MDVGTSTRLIHAPSSGQENDGGKGKKSANFKSDRAALRPLQPNSANETTSQTDCTTTDECTITRKSSKVKNKTKSCKPANGPKIPKKMFVEKEVQTEMSACVDYKMCTSEEPPVEYWQVLAEQRRQALADTLLENEELHAENRILLEKITELERRLENKDYFAMMYRIVCDDSTQES